MAAETYRLRVCRVHDLPRLAEIERAAVELFRGHVAYAVYVNSATDPKVLRTALAAGLLFVAQDEHDRAVGWIALSRVDDQLHVEELDVDPAHGRRGLGARLLEHACLEGRARGYAAVTLSTLSDVPWNAPFYARHGFELTTAAELGPEHERMRAAESAAGFPMDLRVMMRRRI